MESSKISVTLAALYRGLSTEYSDQALNKLKQGILPDFPELHDDTSLFARDYLAYNLVRKVRDPVLGFVPPSDEQLVQEAVSGFLSQEALCEQINVHKFNKLTIFDGNSIAHEAVLHTATRKIDSLLREFNMDEFAGLIDFSNGASTRLPRRRAAVPHKFSGRPHVTRECAFLAMNLIWFHEPWRLYCQERFGRDSDPCSWVEVVAGSEYFTVPKTATKLRGACKEPELNMLCQKAIGSMIRKRLKQVSIDLNDQLRNRTLAREGSLYGNLATIDLSNASDSLSLELLNLLPESWRKMIEMTRSRFVKLPSGQWHELSKISSMGNGFTFELESLIFWALAEACVELLAPTDRRIGIYGDDIIVATCIADPLISVLDYCGFTTNKEKTFTSGPFRESCGGHYHKGVDVTPFYLRTGCELLEDKYHYLNSLNSWLYLHGALTDREHKYIHNVLLNPDDIVFVPPHMGTKCGLLIPSRYMVPRKLYCRKRQMFAFRIYAATARSRKLQTAPGYLSWLLGSLHERLGETLIGRNVKVRPKFKLAYTSKWDDSDVILPSALLNLE